MSELKWADLRPSEKRQTFRAVELLAQRADELAVEIPAYAEYHQRRAAAFRALIALAQGK